MRRTPVLLLLLVAQMATSTAVLAHTEIDVTEPVDGASEDEPVAEIVIAFTEPVTPVDPGFVLVDSNGAGVGFEVETEDDVVFRLVPASPLAGDEYEVTYEVTSADAHVVAGSFRFAVTASNATTTLPEETSVPPSTTLSPSTTGPPSTTLTEEEAVAISASPDNEGSSGTTLLLVAVGVAALLGVAGWFAAQRRDI